MAAYLSGAKPVIVEGKFDKKSNTHNVTPVSSTVTAVRADGDQYYVTLTPSSGYEIPDTNVINS